MLPLTSLLGDSVCHGFIGLRTGKNWNKIRVCKGSKAGQTERTPPSLASGLIKSQGASQGAGLLHGLSDSPGLEFLPSLISS